MLLIITTILIFSSFFLVSLVVLTVFESQKNLGNRLESLTAIDRRRVSKRKKRIRSNNKSSEFLKKIKIKVDILDILAGKLEQANIEIRSTVFLSMLLSGAFVMGLLVGVLSLSITKGFISFIAVIAVVKLILERNIKKRKAKFEEQLNEGTSLIISALQSGYSFFQALKIAAEDTEDPFSTELRYLLKEINLGVPIETGLDNMLKRTGSANLKLIVNAVLIQKDVGGNLSEILTNIVETIRERQRLERDLRTLTAQGRLSGLIVMLLPVVIGFLIYLINKPYILVLFQTKLGNVLLLISLLSEIFGWILIKRIVNIEF